jgi:hypothetical protein
MTEIVKTDGMAGGVRRTIAFSELPHTRVAHAEFHHREPQLPQRQRSLTSGTSPRPGGDPFA